MPKKGQRTVGNLLALAVLVLLEERPMHPYEMARTLRDRRKEVSIKLNYGSLYMVIGQLAAAGFIEARGTVRDNQRPERTIYALTDAGRTEVREWMRELLRTPLKEYRQFEAALSLMAVVPPDEVAALLGERVRRLEEQGRQLRAEIDAELARGLAPVFMVEDEYRLALVQAEQAYAEALIRQIEQNPDFSREWREFHEQRQS